LGLADIWMILVTVVVFLLMDLAANWFGSW